MEFQRLYQFRVDFVRLGNFYWMNTMHTKWLLNMGKNDNSLFALNYSKNQRKVWSCVNKLQDFFPEF